MPNKSESISLTSDVIINSFYKNSVILDESVNKDDTCFYYERGGFFFPYNQNETTGLGYDVVEQQSARSPIYNKSVYDVVNGLTYVDSVFLQTFRKKDTIVESGNDTVFRPNTQISCYLMTSNHDKLRNPNYNVFAYADPSDKTKDTIDGFLPNITSYVLSFIYNNQANISVVDGKCYYESSSGSVEIVEYLKSNDPRISEIFGVMEPVTSENIYLTMNISVKKNSNVGLAANYSVEHCVLDFVCKGTPESKSSPVIMNHKLKVFFDPDTFVKEHIGSFEAIEVFAYHDTDPTDGDNLIYYSDNVYNTISESGGLYNITDDELISFVKTSFDNTKRYKRHSKMKSVSFERLIFKESDINEEYSKTYGIAQKFMIYHSMDDDSEILSSNDIVCQKVFDFITEINPDFQIDGTSVSAAEFKTLVKKVYLNLNFLSYYIFRPTKITQESLNTVIFENDQYIQKDVGKTGKYKIILMPNNSLNNKKLCNYFYIGYFSTPTGASTSTLFDSYPGYSSTDEPEISNLSGSDPKSEKDLLRTAILRAAAIYNGLYTTKNIPEWSTDFDVYTSQNYYSFRIDNNVYCVVFTNYNENVFTEMINKY